MSALTVRREVKEEGGKVFVAELEADPECRVARLTISGDFFAYPAEPLDSLERDAVGRHVLELLELASRALGSVTLVGVSREAALSALRSAVEEVVARCRPG